MSLVEYVRGKKMKVILNFIILMTVGVSLFSCKGKEAIPTISSQINLIKPGDIIVVNMASDSLILLDSEGNYKTVLLDLDNIGESFYGVNFKSDTKEIIFTINGAARVGAISVVNGAYRTLISDTNLTGTLRGLAQLQSGDIIVAEMANIERFTSTGVRRTSVSGVTWPNTLGATANPEQLHIAANGDIIVCGSANVKRFTTLAVQVGSTLVNAGTPQAYGCIELTDGTIAMSFNGTTDAIRVGPSTLASSAQVYSDLAVLGSPRNLTQTLNGNLLTVDSVFNQIVEVTKAGTYVRTLGGSLLGTPNAVFSVPNY